MTRERARDETPTELAPPNAHTPGLQDRAAVLLALSVGGAAGCVLCGYELLRTTGNTLFVAAYGTKALPVIMALIPLGVTLVIYGYGRLLSSLGPRKTLHVSAVLAVATMGLCYLAIHLGIRWARGLLYVFKESYVVLLIEQYWSYIDSTLSKKWAKYLNGPICAVASVGAILGGTLLKLLSVRWGTLSMILVAAVTTLPALLLTEVVFRRYGEPRRRGPSAAAATGTATAAAPVDHDYLGLRLFRKDRMLVLLICLIAAAQLLATVLDLSFKELLQLQIPNPDQQNAFSGGYYGWLNGIALLSQLFLTPVLLTFVGMRYVHLAIPIVHIAACAYLFASPSLYRAGAALMIFKVLDYSVFRAAKELLYVPLSFDVRYRAKEMIDVLGYRASKGITSLGIKALQTLGVTFSTSLYALLGIAGAGVWLSLVWPIARYDKDRGHRPA